jgi:cold shock CspA family protein
MLRGKIKFYNPRLAWGIIETPDCTGYFLHGKDYQGGAFPGPQQGEPVEFELRITTKGRQAVGVKQVKS